MKKRIVPGQKIICLNRKASFNYFFIETLEAGISLKGSEVKSLREGKGSIADSYAIKNNSPLLSIAYESAMLPLPSLSDLTSDPFKEIPASKVSKKK